MVAGNDATDSVFSWKAVVTFQCWAFLLSEMDAPGDSIERKKMDDKRKKKYKLIQLKNRNLILFLD